ncbi:MAG: D-alanyl-D-alanine carboxypeptidase [Saprospiraceae bacterium]
MHHLPRLLLLVTLFSSCSVLKSRDSRAALKIRHEVAHSPVFSKTFTGFTLLDPSSAKTLTDFNGDHYFTPASNTKIFTLAACLEVLGDSVPGLKYAQASDSFLMLRGTADPSFLHPDFAAWQSAYHWLKARNEPMQVERQSVPHFGPGWAWDDYLEPFSAERSDFPIFGNVAKFKRENGVWQTIPTGLPVGEYNPDHKLYPKTQSVYRVENFSYFIQAAPDSSYENGFNVAVPFSEIFYEEGFSDRFLEDTLDKDFETPCWRNFPGSCLAEPIQPWHTLYSTPLDTVLRRMMHQSDNFIAEQMLLVCAGSKFDLLQQDTLIKWMLDSALVNLPQRPKWVDGSGLSRYNLMTPQSIAELLLKLWKEQKRERLFSFFPTGGISGTISNWYAGKNGKPYVFAKTGTLSGVHCLSGYVLCQSGKVLVFSFMHNNFVGSNRDLKLEMQRILELVHDRF